MSHFCCLLVLLAAILSLACEEKHTSVVQLHLPTTHSLLPSLVIGDELKVVTSDAVLNRAIIDANLKKRWSLTSEEIRTLLRSSIQISQQGNSHFFSIEAAHGKTDDALVIASSVAQAFCKIRNENVENVRQQILFQLDTEIEEQEERVKIAGKTMTVFLQQYGQPPTLEQLAESPSFYRATFTRQLEKQHLNHLENQKFLTKSRIELLRKLSPRETSPLQRSLLTQFQIELESNEDQIENIAKLQRTSGPLDTDAMMCRYHLNRSEATYLREENYLEQLKRSQLELRRRLSLPYHRATIHSS